MGGGIGSWATDLSNGRSNKMEGAQTNTWVTQEGHRHRIWISSSPQDLPQLIHYRVPQLIHRLKYFNSSPSNFRGAQSRCLPLPLGKDWLQLSWWGPVGSFGLETLSPFNKNILSPYDKTLLSPSNETSLSPFDETSLSPFDETSLSPSNEFWVPHMRVFTRHCLAWVLSPWRVPRC